MATAAERGFLFKDVPIVIDPATEVIEIQLAPYGRAQDGEEWTLDTRFAQYSKLMIPFEHLPYVQSLEMINLYGDHPDYARADKVFGYGADGVLRAILYRDKTTHRNWIVERMPEEFTGQHNLTPSVRFLFEDLEDARKVADFAGRLQTAILSGMHYDDMQADAQTLVNIIVGKGSEPRLVQVAEPTQRMQF
jgi:hypothetical protein